MRIITSSLLPVLIAGLLLSGCAIAPAGLGARARGAALSAASDPQTWAPLAGAALIGIAGKDRDISEWAVRESPLFGSPGEALSASDRHRDAAKVSGWLAFAAAEASTPEPPLDETARAAGINLAGLAVARGATGAIKSGARRERPYGDSHDSMPSAHASDAFAHAGMGRYYLQRLPVDPPVRTGLAWTLSGFAWATAWGRVEGGVHYPTDVLLGGALGNFIARFFAGMASSGSGVVIQPTLYDGGLTIGVTGRY